MSTDRYLAHHGVKGQKWGIRRYQNADGTLTSEGRKRYNVDMYSHSGNRIYSPLGANAKVRKRSNAANSLQGGAVYNDFERQLKKQLKRDYRDSYKKGYITRDEYRQGKKVAKSSSKKIAEQRLGSTAKRYGRASKITNAAINGTLMATGATLTAYQMKNAIDNVDNSQKYGGYGSYQEINDDGSRGKSHTSWKEVYKDARRQANGKKSKYGYYSFDYDNGTALAHHGVKGMKWGVRKKAKDAWQKHWSKKASQWTKTYDFEKDAIKRKGKLKSEYELFKAENSANRTNRLRNKDYWKKSNQYLRDINSADRDIREMNNLFTTSGQKVNYINADPKKRKALHYLHGAQGVAGKAATAAAIIGAGKVIQNANEQRRLKKAGKRLRLEVN